MEYVKTVRALQTLLQGADHVDVKTVQSSVGMRTFVCNMLAWSPLWVEWLFRLRGVAAKVLGLEHESVPRKHYTPEDLPMTPGQKVGFFTVAMADEEACYVLEAADQHLSGVLAVVAEPLGEGAQRYHLCTIVHYRNWKGPLYFNCIRPFHHLIVARMAKAGARGGAG